VVARRLELLQAFVVACLFEEIDSGRHVGWRAVSVEVQPVRSREDRRAFVDLPFRLHGTGTPWVPPLKLERHLFLSARLNAFFNHGEAQLFLARRGGRVVGRVSAQIDVNFNVFQDNAWGMFGFLEFEEDPQVLGVLLDAAGNWLRERGRDRIVGPMDFTMNDECGVLIEGFERRPIVRQPWHPPYYARMCEAVGLEKAVDLFMWALDISGRDKVMSIIWDLAEQLERKHGITIRKMSRRSLRRDLDAFAEIYNEAWSHNWGFVPYSDADLDALAQETHLVFDGDWLMVAENEEGSTVAVALTFPDINEVLARMNGRLLPFGWWHYLNRRRIVEHCRVGFLGVKPAWQHTGVAAGLYAEHFDMAEVTRIHGGEMGWILETNKAMNRAMEAMGGEIVKKYRVYEHAL
jgi:GNAT superfamily N-acetyltransferase